MKLMQVVAVVFLLGVSSNYVYALDLSQTDLDYLTISSVEVSEVHDTSSFFKNAPRPASPTTPINPIEDAGKVIKVAKDIVAVGEDIYKLVTKGRPNVQTKYEPISVLPTENGSPVDLFSTEGWKAPAKKTYEINYYNIYKANVVKFRFSVFFSYGGTYQGKGAYITAAQIIPDYTHTLFGYDFTATMKLSGIQKGGTKEDPVVGATLLMEHTVNTLVIADKSVNTFYITGKGEIIKY